MAITSGTKMRLRYKRPAGSYVTCINATTMNVTYNTNTRNVVHKDNPGNWDEHLVDGHSGSGSVTFFHENAGTWADLLAAKNAEETVEIQVHDGTTGNELEQIDAIITGMTKTGTVRESVTGVINFTFTGSITISTVP